MLEGRKEYHQARIYLSEEEIELLKESYMRRKNLKTAPSMNAMVNEILKEYISEDLADFPGLQILIYRGSIQKALKEGDKTQARKLLERLRTTLQDYAEDEKIVGKVKELQELIQKW